jgi:Acetolactate synthase (isozyme II), small (regulatory) subunit
MKFTLDISMNNTEGVLERILGRLRQRNFAVCALTAGTTTNWDLMNARITVESIRPPEFAVKQISKLVDVRGVEVFAAEEQMNDAYARQ